MFNRTLQSLGLWILGSLLGGAALASANPGQPEQRLAVAVEPAAQPRDPTRPPGTSSRKAKASSEQSSATGAKSSRSLPVLTSILLSSERRLAVINDKLVREGELVAGMTLVRVAKDEVQLQGKNQALVLRLPKANIGKDYR